MLVRTAQVSDAKPLAELINEIIARGGTTAHRRPFDEQQMIEQFINPPYGISCTVAVESLEIVGFQVLEWSDPNWPGPDKLSEDCGIIATYVALGCHGQGIGRKLFATTLAAAQAAGVRRIDATIRSENFGGQAYYDRMGFVDYRTGDSTVSKRLDFA
ncbi:MAG: GNAT family N-acetyltransferase [Geminicoccaceae bacterium]